MYLISKKDFLTPSQQVKWSQTVFVRLEPPPPARASFVPQIYPTLCVSISYCCSIYRISYTTITYAFRAFLRKNNLEAGTSSSPSRRSSVLKNLVTDIWSSLLAVSVFHRILPSYPFAGGINFRLPMKYCNTPVLSLPKWAKDYNIRAVTTL